MEIKEEDLDQLLEVHLGKPEKVAIYKPRVQANMYNGNIIFKPTWSWWAFFGTWMFFLYRKMYLEAAIFFIVAILGYAVPFLSLITIVISGMSAFYFYTMKFNKDLEIASYGTKPLEEVKDTLKLLGGYNSWVVVIAVIVGILYAIGIMEIVMALSTSLY